jgi:hypothetical protein
MPHSRANLLAAWEKLQAGLETHKDQDELHAVDAYRERLNAELSGLQATQSKRTDLQAESLQATQDLTTAFARTRDLVTVLRAWLILTYGARSCKLLEFGLKPLPQRRTLRRKEEATPWKPAGTV